MRQIIKIQLLLLCLSALIIPVFAVAELTEQGRSQRAAELAALRQRIASLRQELDSTRSLHHSVLQQLRETERDIGSRVRSLKQLRRTLRRQNHKLKKLVQEQQQLGRELGAQRELLSRQIFAAYAIGQQEYLKLLLNQVDPAAASRIVTYYDYFNQARSKRIEAVLQTMTKLDAISKQIQQHKATLIGLQKQQLGEKAALEITYRVRTSLLAQLSGEIASKDQQLQQLSENEKQLQRLLSAIHDAMPSALTETDKQRVFAQLKGKLVWPAKGKVKKLFGLARNSGKLKWNGVMIRAREGNNVYAVSRGRVAYADWLRGYGLLLIIDHGEGYMSLYGHNQSLYKEVGDWVEANELIAGVGNSGGHKEAGLYFEIRHNGKPANPAKWCSGVRRG